MKLLRQDIQRALKQSDDSHALAELKLAKAVLEGHGPGGDLRKLLKQPTPALLKLLLGQHCNVMTLQVPTLPGHALSITLCWTPPHSLSWLRGGLANHFHSGRLSEVMVEEDARGRPEPFRTGGRWGA